MTFGDLQTYIQDVLGRSDIPQAAYVAAQADWVARLQLAGEQTTVTLSAPYTAPDMVRIVEVRHGGARLDPATTFPGYELAGDPQQYRVAGGVFEFWPETTADVEVTYEARPAPLQDANDTNGVLTRFPNVAIYGTLFHTCIMLRDQEGQAAYGPSYREAVIAAKAEDFLSRLGGGQMRPRPGQVA